MPGIIMLTVYRLFHPCGQNNQILGTHDFVIPGSNPFEGHPHGMVVLSVMAGNLPGELIGSAPDASFWLLRSEDTGSEYPIEEDNWASAAEFADSAGADVINSSLGYSQFDDDSMSLTYAIWMEIQHGSHVLQISPHPRVWLL